MKNFISVISIFKHRSYTIFWIGNAFSNLGIWALGAGRSWLMQELTNSPFFPSVHKFFPRRINVQLVVPIGPKSIFILIWERGAGETQASGSSSCAAASAAVRKGIVESPVAVKSPGGTLHIDVTADFDLTMKGPVAEVATGRFTPAFIRTLR